MALLLNCWILGDDSSNIRVFKVDNTTPVDLFRRDIKEAYAPRLDHVPRQNLVLWTVSFAIDDLEKKVAHIDLSSHQKLPSYKELGTFFQDAPDDHLHIIIQVVPCTFQPFPPRALIQYFQVDFLSLNCFILGDHPDNILVVDRIEAMNNVSHLRQRIKAAAAPRLDHLFGVDIELRKVCLTFDQLTLQSPQTLGSKLVIPKALSSLFPAAELNEDHVHVVVHVPDILVTDVIRRKREDFCRKRKSESPSTGGEAQTFIASQSDAETCIPCNRPFDCAKALPLSLIHRVFGKYLDDAERYVSIAEDAPFFLAFVAAMADAYDDEVLRRKTILQIFDSHLRTAGGGKSRFFITDFKNEIGSAGAEPFFQATVCYLEATRDRATWDLNSVLPCLVVMIFGPYIAFAGAAWTDRPTVQMLSPAIPCHFQDTDIRMEGMLMRHLGALRIAIRSLDGYYREHDLHRERPRRNPLYPYPTTYRYGQQDFVYDSYAGDRRTTLFGHLVGDGAHEKICVKFVPYYGEDGHRFLAAKGFAPKLRAVEHLPGGLYMVVMDDVSAEYETLSDLVQRNSVLLLEEHCGFRKGLSDNIRRCLEELHQAGFVHGDVRSTNIMVKRDGFEFGDGSFLLVDYDFCGEAERVQYPLSLNTWTVDRPEGAVGGMVIEPAHDLEMLDRIWEHSSFFGQLF